MNFLKCFGAVVAGMVVGGLVVFCIEMISHSIYPPPADLKVGDMEGFKAYVATLPASALLWVIAAHCLGPFVGAWLASRIAPGCSYWPGIVVTALFVLSCIFNLMAIPHPTWFGIVDVLAPIAFGIAGTHLASRRPLVRLAT